MAALALAWAKSNIAVRPLQVAAVLAGMTTVDLAYNNGPSSSTAQPPSIYEVLEPDTRNATIAILKSKVVADRRDATGRIELAGLGFHWPNASLTHSLENTLGYNPVRLALYSTATGAEDHVGLPDQRQFAPLFPSYRSTLANLLGLRFIVTGAPIETIDPRLKPGDLPLVARTSDGYIYENPDAFPRVTVRDRGQGGAFRAHARRRRLADRRPAHDRAAGTPARRRRHAPPTRAGAHRQLPQHRGDPGGGQRRRRLPRPQRSLAPLVASRRWMANPQKPCAPTCSSAPSRYRRGGSTWSVSTSGRSPGHWQHSQIRLPPFNANPRHAMLTFLVHVGFRPSVT